MRSRSKIQSKNYNRPVLKTVNMILRFHRARKSLGFSSGYITPPPFRSVFARPVTRTLAVYWGQNTVSDFNSKRLILQYLNRLRSQDARSRLSSSGLPRLTSRRRLITQLCLESENGVGQVGGLSGVCCLEKEAVYE